MIGGGNTDILHLKYFIEVARQKNFSKAANAHHVSQSAISKMIKDLEAELGTALFNRTSKSVQLTDAGLSFFNQAQQVVAMFNNLTIGFLPQMTVSQELLTRQLIALPWSGPSFDIKAQLIYHKEKWLSPALQAFIKVTLETLKNADI